MKNYLQVNRALAAEKNFNYFILNQIKSNPDGQPTVNRQSRLMSYQGYLRNLAMIFAILTLSIANIGTAWGSIYATFSLDDMRYTSATLTYEKTGLTNNDQKLNQGERKVEVPCADASGTLYFNGTGVQNDRYASIYGTNGTVLDKSRKVAMTSGYGAGIKFTSADIMTDGGKYYIIFGNVEGSDFKIAGFKYVLDSDCSASGRSFEPGEIVYIKDIKIDNDACMKILGKNIWAVFVDEAGTSSDWAQGDLEKGSWNTEGAIYKMVVPARKDPSKKYVKVIFTRDDWAKQTVDLTTTEPNNLYNLSNNWSGDKLTGGSWGFYTPASKTVYFDNRNVSDWTTAYVRIGHGSWNSAWGEMTKVAGTRHLYTQSTSQWDNHTLFSIANTTGWTGGKNIYQPYEEGGNIMPNDAYKMSQQTNYQKYPIISDAYICPSETSVLERGCQYYKVNSSTSISTFDDDNRLVSLPSYTVTYSGTNCTVTVVKYTNDAGSSTSALSSGDEVDPTRIIKVTVTPSTGYQFSEMAVTGVGTITAAAAGTPGVYYVTDNATISATCTCIDFTPARGGTADGTYTVGEDGGALTCSVAADGSYTYQWKQYTSGQGIGDAVSAVGTGATSTSFTPHPTVAGTYYYFCEVTNSCDVKKTTSTSGTFVFNEPVYDIIYAANIADATGSTASTTGKSAGYTEPAKACGYSKSGYKFKWWNTSADGSGEDFYVGEKVTIASRNVTLYAQWEQVESGWAYWVGDDASSSPTDIAGNGVTMRLARTADYNTDLTAAPTTVNATEKHAKVFGIGADDKYVEISFTDGSPINSLTLGVATKDGSSPTIAVMYSTTSDFSSGEYYFATPTVPTVAQKSKSTISVNPDEANKYKYVRIYRKIKTAVYAQTGGSGNTTRIYSIKAQKGLACVAPTAVNISGTYHYFPGETISLTAAAEGGSGTPTTYQWYKGGTADGNIIEGATNATYSKANCTFADAGSYYCKVTRGGSCSTFSNKYDVKILRLYVKTGHNNDPMKTDFGNVDFTRATATTATASIVLGSNWDYCFNIADGCGHYYGNAGTMQYNNCGPWITNVNNQDCGLRTTNGAAYVFTINYENWEQLTTTVTFPVANQAAGKVIYFDNNDRNWSTLHYRIGNTNHTQATAMDKVHGTANLYKVTTEAYNNFSAWQIGNAEGGNGSEKSIYNTKNTPAITASIAYEGEAVTADAVTVTPGVNHSTGGDEQNNNCEFYTYTITTGMKTQNVSITAPTHGTLTINYVDINDAAQKFSVGNRDLAHTCIITVTAEPADGYTEPANVSINGASHGNRDPYTITGTTVVAATFSPASYTVTLNTNSGTINADNVTSYTYGTGATLPTNVTKDGFTFDGWYDNSGLTGSPVTTISTTATGNKEYWAKWTEDAGSSKCITFNSTSAPSVSGVTIRNVPGGDGGSTYTEKGFVMSQKNDYITFDISALGNLTKATFTAKTNSTGKKIGYGYTENTTTIGEVPGGSGTADDDFHEYEITGIPGNTTRFTIIRQGTGTTITKVCLFYTPDVCSNPVIDEGSTKSSFAGGTWAQNSGHTITITATGADSYEWYRNTAANDDGATKLSETSNTLDITDVTPGTYFFKAVAKSGACSSSTEWLWCGSMTITAATYALTYNCNGAESGCPSNTTASALPNPLPTGLTKDGYTFGGWFTDAELTVPAVAGAALTANKTLYAKWTVRGGDCEDTPHAWTVVATGAKSYKVRISKVTEEVAIPIADATASNLTAYAGSVSTDDNVTVQIADGGSSQYGYKFDGSNTYLKLVFSTPLVLNDTLVVSLTNASYNISFTTTAVRATTLSTSGGKLIIPAALAGQSTLYLWRGSGKTMYLRSLAVKHACDALPPCTTPVIPPLSNQEVCEGSDIAVWNATQTAVLADGETVTYSWKKGNDTELANTATYDLGSSATEAMAGTYVVTATVSADGKASSMATKEVTLTVNEATEVTAIKADKATVYPTNSVILTATANVDATWQWYTCTNAEGDGEAIINDATSASYTIASAPESAGTYYYKVKATGSCGIAERVYTLVVSPAIGGDCFHYVSVLPDKDISPSSGVSIVTPTYATTLEGGTMKVGSSQVTITKNGLKLESTKYVSITLDAALEAGNVVIVKGSTATAGNGVTINGVNFYESDSKTFDVSYTVTADDGLVGKTALTVTKYNGSSYLQEIKITGCGAACNDPEVTASVDNSTACVGSSVTFTATGAHAEATYQWQKYSGGAWTDIADADAATYNIPSVATTDALKYRVIAHHNCDRTSNEVTLSVPVAPAFADFTATRTVMATQALSISDVAASDATSYAWYKSADATYDAGKDTKVGTSKELLLVSGGEAADATYYLFCVASNACGSTTSKAITVNVTALVEEECATKGNEGVADFGFVNTGCAGETYSSTSCWKSGGRASYLTYSAPTGKYLKEAKVTVASTKDSKCGYAYSTDNGTNWTYDELTGLSTTLTEKTINLSGKNVTDFRIGRNLQDGSSKDWDSTTGAFYLSKICFEYSNTCTATTVTPSTSSVDYTMDGVWSNPTFTLSVAGTLTYSSSDEEIASVDENGTVTFNGKAGTVTITAAYAGNATYCASEGSYTITVSCPGGAPKVVAADGTNMKGCNSSITLNAKQQNGTDFADGTYQWFHNGVEIEGATDKSYTATQTGVYTVEYTSEGCTSPSTNHATVTSDNVEPEVERLVPFQYYHVNKTYSDQMKDRHLFSVKGSAAYGSTGRNFKLTMSRNGEAATDITTAASIFVTKSGDGQVDTVMIDLNQLRGKYSEGDKLVLTCAAIDCNGNASAVYMDEITIHVIGAKPTLALICSGTNIAAGTRNTKELTVGGDFLTGYNKADLCQQTGNTTFDANTEWGLYTRLKENYSVTPVNGYAVFNKLNYEPFDILLLTDYPKADKSDAAATVLDDMAALCDYRPMLSFKTHMVKKSPSKWAAKGFTTSPVVSKTDGCLNLNIVCYAHPMFEDLQDGANVYRDADNKSELVYTMLSEPGHEGEKGMQGFEIAAAENFVTIGLTHYNASAKPNTPSTGEMQWTPGAGDRMLVTVAERQTNIEARFILFSLNCGAQSKLTEKGEDVVLACLKYLLDDNPLHVADCSFTFDNGANAPHDKEWYKVPANCQGCTGELGDGLWSTEANWGPSRINIPGEFTSARIAAPVTVDIDHAKAMELRIIDDGSITIPAGKALQVKSTIRRMDGTEIYPTEISDIHIGSASTGNGTLIFDNNSGDTKARVDMYSKGFIDGSGVKNYQYIGTPFIEVNALYNYYGSWIYYWGTKKNGNLGWVAVKNGGPMTAWTGYCITQEAPTYHQMSGTLTATGTVDINVPADANMVVGNSWTAPIDINALTTDDLEGLKASIYFFNTGVDKTGTAGAADSRYAGSTYVTVPVEAARYVGEDDHINSLQGFFVKNTNKNSAGTLHLDYERHVRQTTRGSIIGDALHAPARRTALSSDEPTVLKIKVSGENYDDKLLLLEREDFTEGFDNGWDGDKWDGNESALYIYTTDNNGTENSVSAIPELEGTIIGFRAGEDDAYTLNFEYLNSDEPLYLYDVENNTYTPIMTGMTYRFFTTDNEKHARFIITRSNGQEVATGVGEVPSDQVQGTKAKKLLIENKMFIMVNGMLYDATGKIVK